MDVDVLERLRVRRAAFVGQILELPARHAFAAGGAREFQDELGGRVGRGRGALREQFEGERLQAVTYQQCRRFVEFDMAGRTAPAQDIVVHAG